MRRNPVHKGSLNIRYILLPQACGRMRRPPGILGAARVRSQTDHRQAYAESTSQAHPREYIVVTPSERVTNDFGSRWA